MPSFLKSSTHFIPPLKLTSDLLSSLSRSSMQSISRRIPQENTHTRPFRTTRLPGKVLRATNWHPLSLKISVLRRNMRPVTCLNDCRTVTLFERHISRAELSERCTDSLKMQHVWSDKWYSKETSTMRQCSSSGSRVVQWKNCWSYCQDIVS